MSKKILAAVVASVVAGQAAAITVIDDGTNKFSVGGHLGMRYHYQSSKKDKNDLGVNGDSSRFNFQLESKLNEYVTAFAVGEWGFDVTNHNSSSTFSNRLGYAGVRGDFGSISIGQQWSTYSTVAEWTDTFATAGGDASGLYGEWGDNNGTGRANDALQYNLSIQGLNISAQYQAGGSAKGRLDGDPDLTPRSNNRTRDYSYSMAASYDLPMGLSLGGAYNQTKFVQSWLKDAKAFVAAAKFDQGPIYVSASFSLTKNHSTIVTGYDAADDKNIHSTMEKAHGYEVYGSYQLDNHFKVGAGFNGLRDKASQSNLNDTKLEYYPIEVVYTAGPLQLSGTYTFENSRRNGESVKDNVVAQIRYHF